MKPKLTRRNLLASIAAFPGWYVLTSFAQDQKRKGQGRGGKQRRADYLLPTELAEFASLSVIMGRTSKDSTVISAMALEPTECFLEYGTSASNLSHKTALITLEPGVPVEAKLEGLQANTRYFYRMKHKKVGETDFTSRTVCQFHTQRAEGETFSFGIQGDSHPERAFMSHPDLYAKTLLSAAAASPDFYVCMGDDFSISTLPVVDEASVNSRYTLQRPFLGLVGQSAPVFLLNGNHEQASLFNFEQTDERHAAAVLAQTARNKYFPTIEPDGFYTGNDKTLDGIGKLKDYYAWTWGDALFVVLDNYWHSKAQVDSGLHEKGGGADKIPGEGRKNRDLWDVSLGEEQYKWLSETLATSKAKFKFVFAHHVLGTQRGGVDVCHLFEWGGHGKNGAYMFDQMRPGWGLPVHDLMVKHGVNIFFQGHDHLYCQQEKDGVIYQEVPMPADNGYVTYNEDRYGSGVKLPNSGHLKVTVSPDEARVDYVRCYLPADEVDGKTSGQIAHSYSVKPRNSN